MARLRLDFFNFFPSKLLTELDFESPRAFALSEHVLSYSLSSTRAEEMDVRLKSKKFHKLGPWLNCGSDDFGCP